MDFGIVKRGSMYTTVGVANSYSAAYQHNVRCDSLLAYDRNRKNAAGGRMTQRYAVPEEGLKAAKDAWAICADYPFAPERFSRNSDLCSLESGSLRQ